MSNDNQKQQQNDTPAQQPTTVPEIPFNEGLMIGIDEGAKDGDKTVYSNQILNG
jgi:hypothetical protein